MLLAVISIAAGSAGGYFVGAPIASALVPALGEKMPRLSLALPGILPIVTAAVGGYVMYRVAK